MKLALIVKESWKDLPGRVVSLAKRISATLPVPVEISIVLKDYGAIQSDAGGRILPSWFKKTAKLDGYDGACVLVSMADRKRYGLAPTLRGHYIRDEDGFLDFWVAADSKTKRKGKPQLEETFSHELLHGLYHWVGLKPTPNDTVWHGGFDNTHFWHNVEGDLAPAFAEVAAAWPKPKKAVLITPKSDKLKDVDPTLADFAKRLTKGMASIGHPMFVSEGFRSVERQAELYAQGRTAPGKIVTNAKPGESKHNTGKAVDIVFDAANPWADSHPWNLAGQVGESIARAMNLKVSWGGKWPGFKDLPHWEIS